VGAEVKIPFGYRLVVGQSIKGDGIWNGRRFEKVKKGYPFAGDSGAIIIRKCEVVQPELVSEVDVSGLEVMEM